MLTPVGDSISLSKTDPELDHFLGRHGQDRAGCQVKPFAPPSFMLRVPKPISCTGFFVQCVPDSFNHPVQHWRRGDSGWSALGGDGINPFGFVPGESSVEGDQATGQKYVVHCAST